MIVEIEDKNITEMADLIRPFKGLAIAENYSKDYLANVVTNILTAIEEGYADPLEMHVMGKALKAIGESLEKSTKDQAVMKASQDGRKGGFKGCEFQIKNESTYYDYSKDPVYADLDARLKARKELLSTVAKLNQAVVDEETGELVPKVPIKSGGGETIAISFK